MAHGQNNDLLSNIVTDLFACLGPLRACDEAVQRYVVDPVQECVIDPTMEYCVDPVRNALAINPCGCIPGCGGYPSLPQFDSPREQAARSEELARTQRQYQYNYDLVRTFQNGQQGRGIAVLDSVPFAQLPSVVWLCLVLENALIVLDNLLLVFDLLAQPRRRQRTDTIEGVQARVGEEEDETGLESLALDFSPEELARQRNEVHALRANLLGSVLWGRSIAGGPKAGDPVDPADSLTHPLAPPAPPEEGNGCGCLRCSPKEITRDALGNISNALGDIVRRIMLLPALNRNPVTIKGYNDLFQRIPLPEFAYWFRSDEMFALQRVAGQNPVVIQRIEWDQWSKQFPVSNAEFVRIMGRGDSLERASEESRLYLCDYEESLGESVAGDFPEFCGQKFINAPLALFALDAEDRRVIKPVAIQVGQEPGESNPIFYPPANGKDDPGYWNWQIAKSIVQNSDCNDSEFYRHLGLGHLLTEAFALVTYRTLPRQHPLYVLLTPNYQGMFFTNNTAVTSINVQNSYLNITEMIFSGTVPSTLGIAGNAVAGVDFNDNMLQNNLRERGVDDPTLMPNYPYRDDALLIRDAIWRWVRDYVELYYENDRDVRGDYELRNWARELNSPDGGRIRGIGDVAEGRIETREYLVEAMTEVIYTASAHHALTNFPLDDYELYEPGWPGALYAAPPKSATGATREDWFQYLAKINIAILQQALGFTVGSTYFTKLGYYPICHFNDPRVAGPLAAFQADLEDIEEIINRRNNKRLLRYPYLLPSRIPASTNI